MLISTQFQIKKRMNNLHANELHVEPEEQSSIFEGNFKHPPVKGRHYQKTTFYMCIGWTFVFLPKVVVPTLEYWWFLANNFNSHSNSGIFLWTSISSTTSQKNQGQCSQGRSLRSTSALSYFFRISMKSHPQGWLPLMLHSQFILEYLHKGCEGSWGTRI